VPALRTRSVVYRDGLALEEAEALAALRRR